MDISTSIDKLFSALSSQQDTRTSLATTMLSTAISYLEDGKYTQAVQAFRASISYNPTSTDSTDAYNYLATAYLKLGKNSDAIRAYKASLYIDNSQAETHVNLANIYTSQNQNTEAEKEYKAAENADKTEVLAPYTYGLFLLKNDRASEAVTELNKASKLEANDGNIAYALGSAYNKLGRYSEAETQLKKAIRYKGEDFYTAQYELGNAYIGLGDKDAVTKQVEILRAAETTSTEEDADTLEEAISQPKMTSKVAAGSDLLTWFGAHTPLYFLDESLATPNTSQDFSMQFQFDSEMDVGSVMNIANWSITKANGVTEGFYNNGVILSNKNDVGVTPLPKRVMYDPTTQQATITFSISQNAEGNGTIDPSHLVFKFMGKDTGGKTMDSSADEYDGFADTFF